MNVLEIVGAVTLVVLAFAITLIISGHIIGQKRLLKKQSFECDLLDAQDTLGKFDETVTFTPVEVISLLESFEGFGGFDEDKFINHHKNKRLTK
jgi:hypothetical protein